MAFRILMLMISINHGLSKTVIKYLSSDVSVGYKIDASI